MARMKLPFHGIPLLYLVIYQHGIIDRAMFASRNDLYTGMAYTTGDIKHEMACILYNIGALHATLGAMDNHQTAEGMKMNCSHFQCAAWAFQHLNEKFPQPRETDLCHEIISFLATVCLAQAQECILEKSIVDSRKPAIVAKVRIAFLIFFIEIGLLTNCSHRLQLRLWTITKQH